MPNDQEKKKVFPNVNGRRPKLTEEKITQIEQLLGQGHYINTVAGYIGISVGTWYEWQQKADQIEALINDLDEDTTTPEEANQILEDFNPNWILYYQFGEAVKRANAKAEMKNLEIITKAAKKQWQAAAWFLERRHRDRWAQRIEQVGDNSGVSALDKFLNAVNDIVNEEDEGDVNGQTLEREPAKADGQATEGGTETP